ncbi:MAG: transferase, partial [Chloroflexus aggregans]
GQPIGMQPLTSKGPIVLEDDVWLGYGVVVLSGVTIGSGTVVGAGSVVTKSLPAGVIAVGAPARIVRERTALDINPITMR